MPAVRAGIPTAQDDYEKTEVEGIPFFVRKDMINNSYVVDWSGFWILGQFTVKKK